MIGRLVAGFLLAVVAPGLAEAADCVVVPDQSEATLAAVPACAGLVLVARKRDDPRPNVDVAASWVEFAEPHNAGEWRYNDWVRKLVGSMNFDKPIALAPERRNVDRLEIAALYVSSRLISARYTRRLCCSIPVETVQRWVNVDIGHWTLLAPDTLVRLGEVANFCWRQFADDARNGARYATAFPAGLGWKDDDFDHHQIGRPPLDMVGPVMVNAQVSKERTHRVFVAVLNDQSRWSFSEQGARVDFGLPLGLGTEPFACELTNEDLRRMAHPGASFPP